MSKAHQFNTGDGETVMLNSLQLYALLNLPAQNASWPTYWALRRSGLITSSGIGKHSELTARQGRGCSLFFQESHKWQSNLKILSSPGSISTFRLLR